MPPRRSDDTDDEGYRRRRDNGNGRREILHTILKYGLSTFLVLYFVGAFSAAGMPSPFVELRISLLKHDQDTQTLLRGICIGTWRDSVYDQIRYCNAKQPNAEGSGSSAR